MSARDVIARYDDNLADGYGHIDAILSALTAAGYRIVPPGGLDAASVERCAKELADAAFAIEEDERDWRRWNGPDPRGVNAGAQNLTTARLLRSKAAALRSLIEEPTNDAR